MKKILVIFCVVLSFVFLQACSYFLLMKDESKIRQYFIDIIPINTQLNIVVSLLKTKKYTITRVSEKNGIWSEKDSQVVIGKKYIEVYLGKYLSGLFLTDVVVFLIFNEKNELIDVSVRKFTNGL